VDRGFYRAERVGRVIPRKERKGVGIFHAAKVGCLA
jgi:hypothetical protein